MSSTHTGEFRRPTPADTHEAKASGTGAGRGFSVAGGILGIIAVFVVPILLGPAGIALGYVGHRKGDRHGRTAMIVAGVGMVVGIVLGIVLFQQAGGLPGGGA
ncbi:hypothetical protein [Egicoccus sp. AB-alg2]|uniref:hypothetical protein n=1 Tax=Egicoccus sp. AB-alg2 TaxID=3242693 RepID=UPI00359DE4D8